ncbi:CPP1-like family protein [Cronbergia sp. UHCC 0137]|uniref:CPP1-like family protein n=1 Tax=Cronbergia sp. UHCC 0137 TaxID=3110239 RepID=UPI002B1FED38|nr:CPP1-like family protein [Cronbergia sp. UHCC 0137]MEA5619136.1 CPP1-like family protein [Cronbergia sp. UHCC 0137]
MSDQNPYEKLGVSEDASFDEIQDARNRLLEQQVGEGKNLEMIEAAYDAILMERLRMRQEGKIKVPERIRFPDLPEQSTTKENPIISQRSPAWLQRMLDQPSLREVLLPGVWYAGLSGVTVLYPGGGDQILQLVLVIGAGISTYFLNQKEGKIFRSVIFSFVSLIAGLIVGGFLAGFLQQELRLINLSTNQFSTVLTFIVMWLVSSFLR